MKSLLRWTALTALICAAISPAHAVKLRFNWREGDAFRYRTQFAAAMEATLPFPGAPGPQRLQQTGTILHQEKVLSIQSDGTIELESSNISGAIKSIADGEEKTHDVPKDRSVQKMTPLGKVTEASQDERGEEPTPEEMMAVGPGPAPSDLFDASLLVVFPDRDVKIGDKWNETFEVNLGEGEKPMKVVFSGELLDLVTIDLPTAKGVKCAKIKAKFHIPLSETITPQGEGDMGSASVDAHVRGEFITYFAYEKGVVAFAEGWVTASVKTTASFPPGLPLPPGMDRDFEVTMKMKMNVKTVWQK
ncbi:MAG: hypothetical protein NZT92_03995 [Abditibacteriales bacterium]|nr:hypothetical protein [Abditibacteriales bacterium]MDW8365108.1 hypothetical protein [Abditibacteriales bacterium]